MLLYHITGVEAYLQILKCGYIKPGPKNVWVERKPVGYIKKGGVVWLCELTQITKVKMHLADLGKDNRMTIAVWVNEDLLTPFRPWRGVYFARTRIPI